MKSLFFFPGTACMDELGAVGVVGRNLFPGPHFEGTVVGMRRLVKQNVDRQLRQIDLLPQLLRKSIPHRMLSKLLRTCLPKSRATQELHNWTAEQRSILADKLAAKVAAVTFRDSPEIRVALGFSSMSLSFGKVAHQAKREYALHAQWCHPDFQHELVSKAYSSLGLAAPPPPKSRSQRQLAEYAIADRIWCPSHFVQQSLVDRGIPQDKTFVEHIGVDIDRFKVDPSERVQDGQFVILFVGTVCLQKGIHVLLEALARSNVNNARLVLNGHCDQVSHRLLSEYQTKLSTKRIEVKISPGDPRRFLKQAAMFVLPSVHDAYGIVIPEAMAAGVPVVVSSHAGACEIVRHGENGYIFDSGDPDALADSIERLYRNQEMRESFGRRSEQISQNYSTTRTSQRILAGLGCYGAVNQGTT